MGLLKLFQEMFEPFSREEQQERFRSLLVEIVELRTVGQDVTEDDKAAMVEDLSTSIHNENEGRIDLCLAEADQLYHSEVFKIDNSPDALLSKEIARTLDQGWS